MSRYDKYQPQAGGFRLNLAAAVNPVKPGTTGTNLFYSDTLYTVTVNANGKAVLTVAGASGAPVGAVGVAVVNRNVPANKPIDVMTAGEIVDLDADQTAAINSLEPGDVLPGVGFVSDDGRLVVRFAAPAE